MTDRCCGLCAHNPVFLRKQPTRLQRLWGWFLWKLFRKLPWWLPSLKEVACKDYAHLFCYDLRGERSCMFHKGSTLPEFLACKSCSAFELKHKVNANAQV